MLAQASSTHLIPEPDNEKMNVMALLAKRNCSQIPYIKQPQDDPAYFDLWGHIFGERFLDHPIFLNKLLRRADFYFPALIERHLESKSIKQQHQETHVSGNILYNQLRFLHRLYNFAKDKRKIIKSVHAGLSVKLLYEQFQIQPLIIFRHPASVVASSLRLQLPDSNRLIYHNPKLVQDYLQAFKPQIDQLSSPISFIAAQVGIHYYIWEQMLKKYPNWISVQHEDMCDEPNKKFQHLFEQLGLPWSDEVRKFIGETDEEGTGYSIHRKTSEQIDKWEKELTDEQIEQVQEGYKIFPLKAYQEFVT